MKHQFKRIQRSLLLSAAALAGAVGMVGCAEDLTEVLGYEGDRTPVELAVAFEGIGDADVRAITRAASTVNNTGFGLLTTGNSSSKVKVWIDKGDNTDYTAYTYNVTGAAAIGSPSPSLPYFPGSVDAVNVYAWYPALEDANNKFMIQDDQSTDANYCLSDLLLAQPVQSTRSYVSSTWTVSPAALSFEHAMAKIILTVNPGAGVTVTGVALNSVKPTVPINLTKTSKKVTAVAAGTAEGDATNVTVFSGSLAAEGTGTYAAVIPAQSISGNFITVTATVGGVSGTIVYSLGAAPGKTFNGDTTYGVTLNIAANQVGQTVDISDWTTTTGELTVNSAHVSKAGMRSGDHIKKNPLFWVAQYNVRKGGTAFETSHWITRTTDAGTGTQNAPVWKQTAVQALSMTGSLAGYHVPTMQEQISVIPRASGTGNAAGVNLWSNTTVTVGSTGATELTEDACKIPSGGTGDTNIASSKSYWRKVVNTSHNSTDDTYIELYAVRFVSATEGINQYASAWHYKWVDQPCHGLLIESYILDERPTTAAEAYAILDDLPTSPVWIGNKSTGYQNTSPASAPNNTSLVSRFLPACGCEETSGSSGIAGTRVGLNGDYWSSTGSGSGFYWDFSRCRSGGLREYYYNSANGLSVRLFRDNY